MFIFQLIESGKDVLNDFEDLLFGEELGRV